MLPVQAPVGRRSIEVTIQERKDEATWCWAGRPSLEQLVWPSRALHLRTLYVGHSWHLRAEIDLTLQMEPVNPHIIM